MSNKGNVRGGGNASQQVTHIRNGQSSEIEGLTKCQVFTSQKQPGGHDIQGTEVGKPRGSNNLDKAG